MPVDLHIHTTASDGSDSPAQVIARARSIGLEAIAITDHDTLDGVPAALECARVMGFEVLPGVELGSDYEGKEVHILGYLMDLENKAFQERLAFFRKTRVERMFKMVQKLREIGIVLDEEKITSLTKSGAVGRPHIARAMVEAGAVDSVNDAFEVYIGAGKPAYIPRFKLDPMEAVHLILSAGGVPVMAHPGLACCDGLIPRLVQKGLMGLEVYHPSHIKEQCVHYLELCRKYDLLFTGGSDYHGSDRHDNGRLGLTTVTYQSVVALKEAAKKIH